MGDLVDITTVPKQGNLFYKFTSGSLRFQVKGLSSAGIGFATTPFGQCELWFILGRDGHTSVTKSNKNIHAVATPNISVLSATEFKEFWMQWHDNMICLGSDYEVNPFIAYQQKTSGLKYVTFAVAGNYDYSLQWRFEMPPLREQLKLKPVRNNTPEWIAADSQLPDGALIGGYEKEILYIIRAKHQGSLTPGKFVPSQGLGFISWGGQSHEKSELEVLCGCDCMWVPCSNGRIPAGSVVGGYAEGSNHETLYVGRAVYNDHRIPGKIQPSHKVCYIPYDDREIAMEHYEILVIPRKNAHCLNPMLYDESMSMSMNNRERSESL